MVHLVQKSLTNFMSILPTFAKDAKQFFQQKDDILKQEPYFLHFFE